MKTFIIIFSTLITVICITIIFSLMGESKQPFGQEVKERAVAENETHISLPPSVPVTPTRPPGIVDDGSAPTPRHPLPELITISEDVITEEEHGEIGEIMRDKAIKILLQVAQ
jgi:hypothetical protein